MKSSVRSQRFLGTSCCVVLLLLAAPFSAARSQEKIPREVIDEAAAHGTVIVLVGLKVPWEMESRLSDDELRSHVVPGVVGGSIAHAHDRSLFFDEVVDAGA